MHHTHGPAADAGSRALRIGAAVTLAYVVFTLVVGIWGHSLALISESAHNLTDFLALLLSWLAVYLQAKPADQSRTFGYQRAGVLAAFLNVLTLLVLTLFIVADAIARLHAPGPVHAGWMLVAGIVGVAMNAAIALSLPRHHDLNLRGAFLHMMGDAVSTGLIVIGAIVISVTGKTVIDPALSLVIAGFILWTSWGVFRETLNILLEGAPRGILPDQVAGELLALPGVQGVHDLHIWSLGSQAHALSAHIRIADIPPSESDAILRRVRQRLGDRFHIHHTTVQFENQWCDSGECCQLPPSR
ncbi:MAG: cation diffusion facilitator family transporter [Terriglobales bacterium]